MGLAAVVLVVGGCGNATASSDGGNVEDKVAAIKARESASAAASSAKATRSPTRSSADIPSHTATPAPAPLSTPTPSVTADPAAGSGGDSGGGSGGGSGGSDGSQGSAWANYPWPPNDDGKACPAPEVTSGSGQRVVLLGDSLIRNSRFGLQSALEDRGFSPVFVCWGGKTTQWGISQLGHMADLGLTPSCLVINLGTNDVKNDAVSPSKLEGRLEELLQSASDIGHVMLVNIWANTDLAPSTMAEVAQTPASYEEALGATGVGSLIDWASRASADGSLVGDDGVHDSDSGESTRVELIADAVANNCG